MAQEEKQNKWPRAPEIPEEWQHFILSVLYISLLPLLPLGLELWLKGSLSETSLTLTTAIYSVTVGSSSKSRLVFGGGILVAIIFSSAFGVILGASKVPKGTMEACIVVIVLLTIFNLLDRWNHHMVDRKKFWDFA